jgi:hypothetical protein
MSSGLEETFDDCPPSAWWIVGGTAAGLLLGAGVGALVGDLTYKPATIGFDFGRSFQVVGTAIICAVTGLLLGALISYLWRAHRIVQERFERERRESETS